MTRAQFKKLLPGQKLRVVNSVYDFNAGDIVTFTRFSSSGIYLCVNNSSIGYKYKDFIIINNPCIKKEWKTI